ncbi:hypothetical protein L6R46_04715 [Myxococcota bacterium]|nr:hypothetical protein [Myxococcota bacterium]
MPRFQVRTADGQRQIDDVEELRRLSRIGVVRRDDPVSVDGGPWQRADALPALAGCFDVDLWDAWDGEDDEAKPAAPPLPADSLQVKTTGDRAPRPPVVVTELIPEDVPVVAVPVMPVATPPPKAPTKPSLVKAPPVSPPVSPPPTPPSPPTKPSVTKAPAPRPPSRAAALPPPEPLSVEALEPIDEPIIELPLASVEPLPVVTRLAAGGGAVGRGQVIRFPAGKSPVPKTEPSSSERGRGTPSRPLEREPGPPAPPLVAGPRLSFRWLVYPLLFAVAGLSIWGFTAYVDSLAGYTPAPTRPAGAVADPETPTPPGAEAVEATETPPPAPRPGDDARLNAMRIAIGGDVPVTPPDADRLQDLLYLELQRIAPARDVRVEVVRQSNDRRRSPELVKVWFSVNTGGDLTYELGAVGLVAGKYQARTELEFQEIVALLVEEDGTVRQRSLSPASALKLYRAELDLTTFLLADVPAAPSEAPPEPAQEP